MLLIYKIFLLPIIICTNFLSLYSALNITQMSVPSIAIAPEKQTLSCANEEAKEDDKFQSLQWSKLIDGKWEVFKISPIPNAENNDNSTVKPMALYKLEDMVEDGQNGGTVEFTKSSLSTSGWYKCSVKSTLGLSEKEMQLRVIYEPEKSSVPVMFYSVTSDYITVTCTAPASYPGTALGFFINYELATDTVRDLTPVKVTNTSYGESVVLPMNVAELKIRPTDDYILNGKLQVVCAATFANAYHNAIALDITYDGPIYDPKCLSAVIIALIVVSIVVFIGIIGAIVWFVIRRKKNNSLNRVAEVFNKHKTNLTDRE